MPDEPAPPPQESKKANEQSAKPRAKTVANSALQGRVDYVDITERVAQGVTVKMPVAEAMATRDTQPPGSKDGATSTEAPPSSTLGTNKFDAKK